MVSALFAAGWTAAFGQIAAGFDDRIRDLVSNRNYLAASQELENLRRSDERIFELNNYDYLLARLYENRGDPANAMAVYRSVVDRNSVLSPYALWHLAVITRNTGNLLLERLYLQRLLANSPTGLLNRAASARMARSYFDSGDYAEAIRRFQGLQLGAANTGSAQMHASGASTYRENLVFLGRSFAATRQNDEARKVYLKLLDELPNPAQPDDSAVAAVKGLEGLETGSDVPLLSDTELLRRASVYQFNRDFTGARRNYQTIVTRFPESAITPDAAYQIGRGYAQEAEFDQAAVWFERVLEQYPDHPVSKDALLQAASAYLRLAKYRESVSRYRRFIEKYPDDERVDRAYLNIIDVLRDSGQENDALHWIARTMEDFKDKLPENLSLFAEARMFLARENWSGALSDLEKLQSRTDLGGNAVPGGTTRSEISFLRAYCLEKLGRYPDAIAGYLEIPDGRNEYYGWRATERLQLLLNNDAARQAVADSLAALSASSDRDNSQTRRLNLQSLLRLTDGEENRQKILVSLRAIYKTANGYNKLPSFKLMPLGRQAVTRVAKPVSSDDVHKQIADELFFLGLYDEAAPELEASYPVSTQGAVRHPDFDYTLAVAYTKGDLANRGVGFIEPQWRNVPADYQIDLIPREDLELLFPAPYKDSLLRYAMSRSIDPRFILSIMRQESRFRADVKSYAAARGLMQFISTTSDRVAAELGRKDFEQDELYSPSISILFGSQYLAGLFKKFPGQPEAVAASYNGGDDNMLRWLTRSKSNLPEQYVPEIGFAQSKDYVYKVMSNYRVYKFLYTSNLQPARQP